MTGPKGFLVPVWCDLTGWAAGGEIALGAEPNEVRGVEDGRAGRLDALKPEFGV